MPGGPARAQVGTQALKPDPSNSPNPAAGPAEICGRWRRMGWWFQGGIYTEKGEKVTHPMNISEFILIALGIPGPSPMGSSFSRVRSPSLLGPLWGPTSG